MCFWSELQCTPRVLYMLFLLPSSSETQLWLESNESNGQLLNQGKRASFEIGSYNDFYSTRRVPDCINLWLNYLQYSEYTVFISATSLVSSHMHTVAISQVPVYILLIRKKAIRNTRPGRVAGTSTQDKRELPERQARETWVVVDMPANYRSPSPTKL
jgi:hypothetical protein